MSLMKHITLPHQSHIFPSYSCAGKNETPHFSADKFHGRLREFAIRIELFCHMSKLDFAWFNIRNINIVLEKIYNEFCIFTLYQIFGKTEVALYA